MSVTVKLNNPVPAKSKKEIEILLKIFKRKIKDNKVLKIYNDRMYYIKDSDVNRKKRAMSKYRSQQITLKNRE